MPHLRAHDIHWQANSYKQVLLEPGSVSVKL